MQVNDTITLTIDALSYDAMGIGETEGKKVFVTNALPGEEVKAKIIQVKNNSAVGQVQKFIKKSPERNNGENDEWAKDGFANLADLKYEEQLKFKQRRIENLLKRAGLADIKVEETLPSPEQVGYRNQRMVYVRNYKGQLEFGFLTPFTHEFKPIAHFLTTNKEVEDALLKMRQVLRDLKIPAYDPKTHTGFVRNVDVRRSNSTGKIMIILIVNQKDRYDIPNLLGAVYAKLPTLYSLWMNYNPHRTEQVWGKTNIPLWGEDFLTDEIGGLKFEFSPESYFQFNSAQAPRLRNLAIKEADLKPDDVIIDAYSGVGTIGLLAASHVKAVRGIEKVAVSVADARNNAKLNKIDNAKFYKGNADQVLARWQKAGFKADVIFVDPPKKGLSKGFIEAAAKMGVKKIVYISANPATLVRDLKLFKQEGYHCDHIKPVDASPQISDIKSVTVLSK